MAVSQFPGLLPAREGHRVAGTEYAGVLANRIYYSKLYYVLYGGMLALNLVVITWTLLSSGMYPRSLAFEALEVTMVAALTFEVLVRMVAQRGAYWRQPGNYFDLLVTLLCVVSLVVYFQGPSEAEEMDNVLADVLLVVRNTLQYLRLAAFLRHRRSQRLRTGSGDAVDFSEFEIAELMGAPHGEDEDDDAGEALEEAPSGAGGSSGLGGLASLSSPLSRGTSSGAAGPSRGAPSPQSSGVASPLSSSLSRGVTI